MLSTDSTADYSSSVIKDMKWLRDNVLTDGHQAKAGAETITHPE